MDVFISEYREIPCTLKMTFIHILIFSSELYSHTPCTVR